ncbi:MAG: lipoyl(octanoyl) transferase LipB [Deltaproteobacteria bacterium]|nr:lipoyl(octanoyl) transferase LipB [Deltaproteobacteria bacterium]
MTESPLEIAWLGRVGYAAALALQDELVDRRRRDQVADRLLLLEHDPVLTFGRRTGARHLLADRGELAARGIELVETDRGGDITYHGPGQLVGYLILRLVGSERSVPRLFERLERGVVDTLASYGIASCGGTRRPADATAAALQLAGVWVGRDKICALGLRLSDWITKHGLALNVDPELSEFELIVPCGLADRGVTSMRRLLGAAPPAAELRQRLAEDLAGALERRPVWLRSSSLDTLFRPPL